MTARWLAALALLLTAASARGAPVVVKIAHPAPEGSIWARTVAASAREIETASGGQIVVKVYPGAVAGDELEEGDRLQRGQLDAVVSGGPLCQRAMPSMLIFRLP